MLRRFLGLAVVLWLQAPVALAQSGDAGDARERFLRGQTAYQEGKYDLAIEEWKAAYALDPRSRILFNLSQAYERAGKLADAVATLEQFLERIDEGDPVRETAIARLSTMRERLRRTGLRIVDAPSGAAIFVDGEAWGLTPRPDPIALGAGNHTVELRLAGHEDFRAQVHVPAGETVDVPVAMESLEAERSRLPLVLASAGAGVAAVGLVVGGLALAKSKDAPYSSGGAADTAHRMAISADVMMAVGGAAVVGAGILWLVSRKNGEDDAPPAISAAPLATRDVIGAQAALRF